ncbi:MAG: hypothetical protein M3121_06245, partial [Chloroflexota bacterium]|nr:hypothetical protein [Chloroflexota bacterium]
MCEGHRLGRVGKPVARRVEAPRQLSVLADGHVGMAADGPERLCAERVEGTREHMHPPQPPHDCVLEGAAFHPYPAALGRQHRTAGAVSSCLDGVHKAFDGV